MFEPSFTDRESSELLQRQYQASSTIYGSKDPVEILEALAAFLNAAYPEGQLALVDLDDPSVVNVLAQIDATGAHVSNFQRPLADYPAADSVAAVDLLVIDDIETDIFLEPHEIETLREQGVKSLLMAPMVTDQQLIGLVYFFSESPVTLSAVRQRAFRSLIDQAAIVFENQRLLENAQTTATRLKQQVDALQTLSQLTRSITQFDAVNPMLEYVAEALKTAANVDHVGILVINDDVDLGTLRAEFPNTGNVGQTFDLRDNLLFSMALEDTSRPLVVENAQNSPAIPEPTKVVFRNIGIHGVMIALLLSGREVLGSIGFDLYQPGARFADSSIEIARIVGTQIAITMQNIRLLQEARERAAAMQDVARVEAQVSQITSRFQQTASVDELLRTAIGELSAVLGAQEAAIRLGSGQPEGVPAA
jgi:GAF domain-containing protein